MFIKYCTIIEWPHHDPLINNYLSGAVEADGGKQTEQMNGVMNDDEELPPQVIARLVSYYLIFSQKKNVIDCYCH